MTIATTALLLYPMPLLPIGCQIIFINFHRADKKIPDRKYERRIKITITC